MRESAIWRTQAATVPVDPDLVQDEIVGRLGLDMLRLKVRGREVLQVTSVTINLRTGLDRRSEYVSVTGIGKLEAVDEWFVAFDKAVPDRLVHQMTELV